MSMARPLPLGTGTNSLVTRLAGLGGGAAGLLAVPADDGSGGPHDDGVELRDYAFGDYPDAGGPPPLDPPDARCGDIATAYLGGPIPQPWHAGEIGLEAESW